jgi:hypothetical protein
MAGVTYTEGLPGIAEAACVAVVVSNDDRTSDHVEERNLLQMNLRVVKETLRYEAWSAYGLIDSRSICTGRPPRAARTLPLEPTKAALHLRARPTEVHVQGMRRQRHLRARPTEEPLQGMPRIFIGG